MNFDYLNDMIKYIEENLENEIDINYLGKITKTNRFILERIFVFLNGITINEYIKKRRLSKAYEDIKNTNLKIIDIAMKYRYNSAPAFNRAFKNLFGVTPTEARTKKGQYKIIPMIYFEKSKDSFSFDYEIKKISSITLYCYHITTKSESDLLYKIRHLYDNIRKNGSYQKFNERGMFGIFYRKDEDCHYYLGSITHSTDLEEYTLREGNYAIFKLLSREQKDIVSFEKKITNRWIPSTNYKVSPYLKIEFYKDDHCYIFLPLE